MQGSDTKLRIIENRLYNIMQLIENIEKNLVNQEEKFNEKFNAINNTIQEIRRDISRISMEINAIKDQLPLFATKDRVEIIEKYIDMLDPFSFVTKKEVERIIEKKIKQMLKSMEIKY